MFDTSTWFSGLFGRRMRVQLQWLNLLSIGQFEYITKFVGLLTRELAVNRHTVPCEEVTRSLDCLVDDQARQNLVVTFF